MVGIAIQISQELVTEECPTCHQIFAITAYLQRQLKCYGYNFFCPSGHSQTYSDTEITRVKREKEALEKRLQIANNEAQREMQLRERAEKSKRRLEKRVHNGVCPKCNRTFRQLAAHMKSKHGEGAPQ